MYAAIFKVDPVALVSQPETPPEREEPIVVVDHGGYLHVFKDSAASLLAWQSRARPKHTAGEGKDQHVLIQGKTAKDGVWLHHDGTEVHPEIAARLGELKIPPAWTNVKLYTDPNKPLQATGLDDAGRTQPRYSKAHSEAAAAEKFARVRAFNDALPEVRKKIEADLKKGDERTRAAAAALSLIEKTGFRPGSKKDTGATNKKTGKAEKHFGITTLQRRHIKVKGPDVTLDFMGKSGKQNKKTVTDKTLAAYLSRKVAEAPTMFSDVLGVSDGALRDYMKSVAGKDFTPKDFRTWQGTAKALRAISEMPVPKTQAEFEKARLKVGDIVSEHLGNTRTVALGSYVDPTVFSAWNFVHIPPVKKPKKAKKADILPDYSEMTDEEMMDDFYNNVSYDEYGDWKSLPPDEGDE